MAFSAIAGLISIYSFMCIIRIFLTWAPGLSYNPVTRFFSRVCDPFLNIFSRTGLLRFGQFDFSPLLAFAVLSFLERLFTILASGSGLTLAAMLTTLITLVWIITRDILIILIAIILIRFIITFTKFDSYSNSMLSAFDYNFNPFIYNITNFITGKKPVNYRKSLAIAGIALALLVFLGNLAVQKILMLIVYIPL